jgi:hypothetical protein
MGRKLGDHLRHPRHNKELQSIEYNQFSAILTQTRATIQGGGFPVNPVSINHDLNKSEWEPILASCNSGATTR